MSEAREDFRALYTLLVFPDMQSRHYFLQLSITAEEAYFTLNKRMDVFLEICERSIEYRDFIRSVMEVLGELEANGESTAHHFKDMLGELTLRTREIIDRITMILSSREGSRIRHGLPL